MFCIIYCIQFIHFLGYVPFYRRRSCIWERPSSCRTLSFCLATRHAIAEMQKASEDMPMAKWCLEKHTGAILTCRWWWLWWLLFVRKSCPLWAFTLLLWLSNIVFTCEACRWCHADECSLWIRGYRDGQGQAESSLIHFFGRERCFWGSFFRKETNTCCFGTGATATATAEALSSSGFLLSV